MSEQYNPPPPESLVGAKHDMVHKSLLDEVFRKARAWDILVREYCMTNGRVVLDLCIDNGWVYAPTDKTALLETVLKMENRDDNS